MPTIAGRLSGFTESVIREMTRIANAHDAVNLAQGFPDWDPPPALVEAARRAIDEGHHQYAVTWGSPSLLYTSYSIRGLRRLTQIKLKKEIIRENTRRR